MCSLKEIEIGKRRKSRITQKLRRGYILLKDIILKILLSKYESCKGIGISKKSKRLFSVDMFLHQIFLYDKKLFTFLAEC
jgi:hypothetical protein